MGILIWFRNDLRLHDHEPLHRALQAGARDSPRLLLSIPRQFDQTAFGFPKTGACRAQFLIESVAALRQSLRQLGSDLIVRQGQPEAILPGLARHLAAIASTGTPRSPPKKPRWSRP
jgi:deoxyribodipyrimidine photo-lyase